MAAIKIKDDKNCGFPAIQCLKNLPGDMRQFRPVSSNGLSPIGDKSDVRATLLRLFSVLFDYPKELGNGKP